MFVGELKPFQDPPVDEFLARGSLLVSFDMGLGKTPIAIAAAEELLGCGDISIVLIVCPPSLKYQWAERLAQFTDGAGVVLIDGNLEKRKAQYASITDRTDYVVIGYPNITSDSRQVRKICKDMVVLDECFVAGTLVDTPTAPVDIEWIRPGQRVLNAEGVTEVEAVVSKQYRGDLYRFTLADGSTITTTASHKFFMVDSVKKADAIREGDYIVQRDEALRVLREGTSRDGDGGEGEEVRPAEQESVLRRLLLSEMAHVSTVLEGCVHTGARTEDQREPGEVTPGTSRAVGRERQEDSGAEASTESRGSQEGIGNAATEGTQALGTWWQWTSVDGAAGHVAGAAGQRVDTRTSSDDGRRVPAASLQDRSGASGTEDRRGDRRGLSQFTEAPGSGQAKGRMVEGTRVVRVEVHEPGSAEWSRLSKGRDYVVVYDLQVRGHPSYSVHGDTYRDTRHGHLVHNCTAIKTFKAGRTKDTKRILSAEYRMGLTGTPMENGKPEEIFSIMQWVDDTVLGRWDLFDRTYIKRRRGTNIVKGYKNLPVLHDRLKVAMSRKSRNDDDVRPYLPTVEYDEWEVPLEGPLRTAYMAMGRDLHHGLKAARLTGDFDVFAHYHGEGGNTPDGRLMSIHMCMEMLLNHPDLVVESAMHYEAGLLTHSPVFGGSKYAYKVWQDGLLDDVFDTPKAELLKEKVDAFIGYGNKTLSYTKYRTGLPYLQEYLGHPSVLYHGQMSAAQKAAAIDKFTDPDGPNLFLSSWAGAYGCDMHMARHLINFDNPWSAGTADQINGRHVRLSNEFDKVFIHTLFVSGTIEERMLDQQGQKRRVNRAVVDGKGADGYGRIDNSVESLTSFLEQTIDGV